MHPEDQILHDIVFFDYQTSIECGLSGTGYELGILIKAQSRNILLEAIDPWSYLDFLIGLKQALTESHQVQKHRFASFAPVRSKIKCKCYVDAEEYMKDVCNALERATNEVYITDWWLSPELFLKRPVGAEKNQHNRLDKIL